jgi:hypothetical protein
VYDLWDSRGRVEDFKDFKCIHRALLASSEPADLTPKTVTANSLEFRDHRKGGAS